MNVVLQWHCAPPFPTETSGKLVACDHLFLVALIAVGTLHKLVDCDCIEDSEYLSSLYGLLQSKLMSPDMASVFLKSDPP
jgi:hypothetical protein